MATKYWEPKANSVAQVSTLQVTAYDATTTYDLDINGVTVATTIAAGSASLTATALDAAFNLSTHPYATGITSSVATDTLTFTADVAEVPFTITPNVTTGTGTFGSFTTTTPAAGPHTWDNAINWDAETLPINSDTIVLRQSSGNIAWGLDGLSTTGHALEIEQSFTGLIGLEPSEFATSATGGSTSTDATEYRAAYMTLDCASVEIGRHDGPGDPGGSRRLMINNDRASASQTIIHRTGANGSTQGRPAALLKMAHASADVDMRRGSVGVGVGVPGEAVTVGDVLMSAGTLTIGNGVTMSNYTQRDGNGALALQQATLTKATVYDGQLLINGDQVISTLEVRDGRVTSNITGTIGACNQYGGEVDYLSSNEARTVTAHKLFAGGGARVAWDPNVVTLTLSVESTAQRISAE